MTKMIDRSIADDIRSVVRRRLAAAHGDLDTAMEGVRALSHEGSPEQRELAETRVTIALDRIAELQTDLVEADMIETETAVRAFERSAFASGADYLRSAAHVAGLALDAASRLRTTGGDGGELQGEVDDLMKELDELRKLLDGMSSGMEGVADNTEANADKERALKPETAPGGKIGTVERPPVPGNPGSPNGGAGGGGGISNSIDISIDARARAQGGAGGAGGAGAGGAGGAGGAATSTATASGQARRRRLPEITLAIRVTNPLGDVNEGDAVDIAWTTEGGTAPRTVTIELFAPQTRVDHPADFHPIVEGARDTGTFRWAAAVPSGHYTGLTITSPTNPVSLPGFYIRVTVTDVSGVSASDTTPIFAIVRR